MSTIHTCDECGAEVTAESDDDFGVAFLTHVRASHPDWTQYPDVAVVNYGEALLRVADVHERVADIGSVAIEPVTEERLDDWLSFFDHEAFAGNPAWAACYCTEPLVRVRGAALEAEEAVPWRDRRAQMTEMLRSGYAHGYLAYVDDRPAGWVNASTRSSCALYRLGLDVAPADDDVVSVPCFVIAPPYRRHGLADALLSRVVEDAAGRGVSWIEAYPPTEPREDDAGNFRGPRSLFERHGFEAAGEDGRNTVMRRGV